MVINKEAENKEKYKILFVLDNMICGGVQRSLIELLKYMPRSKFDITIMLIEMEGSFLPKLPNDVKVCKMKICDKLRNEIMQGSGTKRKIVNLCKQGEIIKAVTSFYRRTILLDELERYSIPFSDVEMAEDKYDMAICYHIHCFFLIRYVALKVMARKKVCWIHNDFQNTGLKLTNFKKDLKNYDRIYCVSRQITDETITKLPEMKQKIKLFNNIMDVKYIREKALEFVPQEMEPNRRTILSVGRLTMQKGFDMAIDVAKELSLAGYEFDWVILGGGGQYSILKDKINQYGLGDKVRLLGQRENPYPYFKSCYLFVQSSRHEGRSIALDEACALGCAIISTNVSGVREQIKNGITGSIIEFDKEQLKRAIKESLDSPELVEKYRRNLSMERFNGLNQDQLEDFFKVIE